MGDPEAFTILLVDDDEALRKALSFEFRRKGFRLLEAGGGMEAYDLVRSEARIDLVLTDVRMPRGDGIELLERLKARDPALPVVIFVTGFSDLSIEDAYAKGAAAVFSKPFDRKELLAAVLRSLRPAGAGPRASARSRGT